MEQNGDIWVWIETARDGAAKETGLELLGAGRALADQKGVCLVGIVIGNGIEKAVRDAGLYGADRILVVEGKEYAVYTTDAYVCALYALVRKYEPAVFLAGATWMGRDLAPRLACRLETGLTADCTGMEYDGESGLVRWTRPALGGNLLAAILCPEHRPQMGTVRGGVFQKAAPDPFCRAVVIREDIHVPSTCIRTEVLQFLERKMDAARELMTARVIVAGGRGAAGPGGFEMIRELAELLEGAVGASRGAVEAGLAPRECQVGQTGITVSPDLYIACGISGAVQHLTGIARADTVIAVNRDPGAPFFQAADYGIVGDVEEILPELIAQMRSAKYTK